MQTFLIKNKNNQEVKKIAGVIFGAPFFDFHAMAGLNIFKRILIYTLSKDHTANVSKFF